MAKYCYAIKKGYRTGIVYSWDECKKAIDGFSGAVYKGFNTDNEAYAYLKGETTGVVNGSSYVISKPQDDKTVNIFTDGSYKDGDISFGVFIQGMNNHIGFYGLVSCSRYSSINNIAGEIFGVLVGVQLAIDMGFKNINILYDYQGLENWYKGIWNYSGELQGIYVALLNNLRLSNDISYNFIKVKGHSNVDGNKKADQLAARGRNFKEYVDMNAILRGILTVRDVPMFSI